MAESNPIIYAALLAERRRQTRDAHHEYQARVREPTVRTPTPDDDTSRNQRREAARNRQRAKRARDASLAEADTCYSRDELQLMDVTNRFEVPSAATCNAITEKLALRFGPNSWATRPCAVCECSYAKENSVTRLVDAKLVEKMHRCLLSQDGITIPQFIKDQYDASQFCDRLSQILLYPPGIYRPFPSEMPPELTTCSSHLDGKSKKPPAWAIANGNHIGWIPDDFPQLNRTEEMAIALLCPCVNLSTVTGGPRRVLKSHHYVVKNTEGPIAEMLPRDLSAKVRVTVVGPLTPAQEASCRQRYAVSMDKCHAALTYLRRVNPRYHTAPMNTRNNSNGTTNEVNVNWASVNANADTIRDTTTYNTSGSEPNDSTAETTWLTQTSLIMDQTPQSSDFLVRRSNVFAKNTRWESCVEMFPTLFPGGCGGPGGSRNTRLSVKSWVKRCLLLHQKRFAIHYGFLFLGFDYIALAEARNCLYFRFCVRKTALAAGSIPREVVNGAIQYQREYNAAERRGCAPPPVPESIREILNIRRGLNACEGAYYGSNQERSRARHDLFGYMRRIGPLQVFFTLSPDSAGTYTIAQITGNVSSEAVEQAHLALLPSRAQRRNIAGQNPVACAQYYVSVIESTIEHIIGWDKKYQRPKRHGGIFGVAKDFVCATETQVGGDLHAHFVIWLHGFPESSRKTRELLENDSSFRARVLQLVDSTTTTTIPVCASPPHCVQPSCEGELHPKTPGIEAFRRPALGAVPVATSECSACGKLNSDKDVMNAAIGAEAARFGIEISTDHADFYSSRTPASVHAEDSRLEISLVIRNVQVHFWTHTRSCFKITSRTPKGRVCRFFRPADVQQAQTFINQNMEITQHRPVGSEYVNGYNTVVLNTFKCNHDIRFIMGCSTKNVAAYICKYCMKAQNNIENEEAFAVVAYAKGQLRAQHQGDATALMTAELGYQVLSTMLYALTSKQEIAGPMAALYLLRGSPFWFSREPVRANLAATFEAIDHPEEEEVTATTSDDDQLSVARSSRRLISYWRRPERLEELSLIEYLEEWQEHRASASTGGEVHYRPLPSKKIFVVTGKQIPCIQSSSVDKEFYYRCVMTLFMCHRSDAELRSNGSYAEAYAHFVQTAPRLKRDAVKRFEETLADYYASEREDSQSISLEEELLNSRPGELEPFAYDTQFNEEAENNSPEPPDTLGADADSEDLPTEDSEPNDDRARLHKAQIAIDSQFNLRDTIQNLTETMERVDAFSTNAEDLTDYSSRIQEAARDTPSTADLGTTEFIQAFPNYATAIEKFEECFHPIPWREYHDTTLTSKSLPRFPSILQVSQAFHLNFWQHTAFDMMARQLLHAYLQDCSTAAQYLKPILQRSPYAIKTQLRGYLGGDAGAGKSTVIHAVLAYAKLWGREGTVETLSFTGVAAINIEGRTIHSARNLTLSGYPKSEDPSQEMTRNFQRVRLVIVDELSMIDQSLLGVLDHTSRKLSGDSSTFMGGKHYLLCGDWLQLPPVGGVKCFVKPRELDNEWKQSGFKVYDGINFIVFLTDNMRSRTDPTYSRLVRRARWGSLLDEDIALLNSRVVDQAPVNQGVGYRPVIVATNELRSAINFSCTLSISKQCGAHLFECTASATRSRSQEIVHGIRNVNDELTDRIPMRLIFFIGMPIMITKKHPDLKDANIAANGTIGTIVGYTSSDTEPEGYLIDGIPVRVFQQLPHMIFVKVRGCTRQLVSGFPCGVIGIPPMTVQVKLKKIPNLSACSVTVRQFPIVPCFACTTEKLQGQTCKYGVIITKLTRTHTKCPPQTLYVALSRTVTLAKLCLTEPLSRSFLDQFQPKQDVIQEMRRLQSLVSIPRHAPTSIQTKYNKWIQQESMPTDLH